MLYKDKSIALFLITADVINFLKGYGDCCSQLSFCSDMKQRSALIFEDLNQRLENLKDFLKGNEGRNFSFERFKRSCVALKM